MTQAEPQRVAKPPQGHRRAAALLASRTAFRAATNTGMHASFMPATLMLHQGHTSTNSTHHGTPRAAKPPNGVADAAGPSERATWADSLR